MQDKTVNENLHVSFQKANELGLRLLERIPRKEPNRCLSPEGILCASWMLILGAAGRTEADSAQALGMAGAGIELGEGMVTGGRLLQPLPEDRVRFRLMNALWLDKSVNVLDSYRKALPDLWNAHAYSVDFKKHLAQTREIINNWIAAQTCSRVRNAADCGLLFDSTRMAVSSTAFVQGSWTFPFPESASVTAPFNTGDGETVSVRTMAQDGVFNYFEDDTGQCIELPLSGDRYVVHLHLPRVDRNPELTWDNMAEARARMAPESVHVQIPSFRVTRQQSLREELTQAGLHAVSYTNADFSGVTETGQIRVADFIHGASFEFAEGGLGGVRSGQAGIHDSSRASSGSEQVVFKADRPFTFAVIDTKTEILAMLGRLDRP